jgi:hypothetical protein
MTQETTTQAATTTEGNAESVQADQSATGAEQVSQQVEGQAGAAAPGAEGEKAKPEGAPESYEFAPIEGVNFDTEVIGAFSEAAKKANLTQDAAQGLLAEVAPVMAARQAAQIEAAKTAWAESSKADKEFGGEKLQANLAVAQKAMDAFGSPELKTLLNESGLGNHPEVIRLLFKAGNAISEDRFRGGSSGAQPTSDARRLYSASNMNP